MKPNLSFGDGCASKRLKEVFYFTKKTNAPDYNPKLVLDCGCAETAKGRCPCPATVGLGNKNVKASLITAHIIFAVAVVAVDERRS